MQAPLFACRLFVRCIKCRRSQENRRAVLRPDHNLCSLVHSVRLAAGSLLKDMCDICRYRMALVSVTLFLAALLVSGCAQNKVGMEADPNHMMADPLLLGVSFTLVAGFLSPLFPALLLVLTTTGEWGTLACGSLGRSLTWLSGLSYDIYLLHPLVRPCLCCKT